jgi:DNA-binding LacI/PurR family transcriptional regulator
MKGIRRLAQHLDISIGTVSRALNGRPDVNEETRKRVLEAAGELGYVPNQSGRSLRQGTTNTIGLMMESSAQTVENSDNFFMGVVDGAQSVFATSSTSYFYPARQMKIRTPICSALSRGALSMR